MKECISHMYLHTDVMEIMTINLKKLEDSVKNILLEYIKCNLFG